MKKLLLLLVLLITFFSLAGCGRHGWWGHGYGHGHGHGHGGHYGHRG